MTYHLKNPQSLIEQRVAIIGDHRCFGRQGLVFKIREDAAMVRLENSEEVGVKANEVLFLELGPEHFDLVTDTTPGERDAHQLKEGGGVAPMTAPDPSGVRFAPSAEDGRTAPFGSSGTQLLKPAFCLFLGLMTGVVCGRHAYSETPSELAIAHSFSRQPAHFDALLVGELGRWVCFAYDHRRNEPSFSHCIHQVVARRSEPQMIRVAAQAYVTGMTDEHLGRNASLGNGISSSMSLVCFATEGNTSVPIGSNGTLPNPAATIGFVNP